ncbi:MAG: small multi-drug export protein [Firmicutes bacterium]|nr:small multi-drug export protein [Bacillota bacterium]
MDSLFDLVSREITVLMIAMLPAVELRGAVPVGVALGMPLIEAFILSYVGSLLPALPLIYLIRPIVTWAKGSTRWRRFGSWLERRSLRKARRVRNYQAIGLFLFVAIPIPGTGVWTGSMIAGLLGFPVRTALKAIAAGNLVAGLIVTFLTHQLG